MTKNPPRLLPLTDEVVANRPLLGSGHECGLTYRRRSETRCLIMTGTPWFPALVAQLPCYEEPKTSGRGPWEEE